MKKAQFPSGLKLNLYMSQCENDSTTETIKLETNQTIPTRA